MQVYFGLRRIANCCGGSSAATLRALRPCTARHTQKRGERPRTTRLILFRPRFLDLSVSDPASKWHTRKMLCGIAPKRLRAHGHLPVWKQLSWKLWRMTTLTTVSAFASGNCFGTDAHTQASNASNADNWTGSSCGDSSHQRLELAYAGCHAEGYTKGLDRAPCFADLRSPSFIPVCTGDYERKKES